MKRIAVASGKGGTGKTTVAVNLLVTSPQPALFVDADVEEPNAHLFLHPDLPDSEKVVVFIPKIDQDVCNYCGICQEACAFNALVTLPDKVLFFPELCHACGLCTMACPVGAITEEPRPIGEIAWGEDFMMGRLTPGESTATPVIKALAKKLPEERIVITDAPPGTACAMLSAIDPTDYVILVTEPTPFGLSDLQFAVGVCRERGKPFGVVINRALEDNTVITNYLEEENIRLLATLPQRREWAESYSRGKILARVHPEVKEAFDRLWNVLLK